MRLLIQRVREARVTVDGRVVGEIGPGLAVLAGFGGADASDLPRGRLWSALVEKMLLLRVFPDASGKMNLGLADFGGEILLVCGHAQGPPAFLPPCRAAGGGRTAVPHPCSGCGSPPARPRAVRRLCC